MNEYYYLNAQNTPQGPHSLDELAGMMSTGRVNPTTLVACKGGSSWEPLGTLLSRENIEAPELQLQPGQVGNCPSCGHDLTEDLKSCKLPANCPSCGRGLRPAQESFSFLANWGLVFRNYFKFSGRATRSEFWSFQLLNFLIILATYVALIAGTVLSLDNIETLAQAETEQEIGEAIISAMNWGTGAGITVILGFTLLLAWALFTFIPNISVMVRRLHDVGWSGKWLLLYLILCFLIPLALGIFSALTVAMPGIEHEGTLITLVAVLSLIHAANGFFGFFLFILTLLDSKRGANKYGPSPKYPLG